ncbi:MAG: 23S rRNA (adenine(2503)-C(2))-methyltransferase RlmN [Acidobacteriota bacterium]
MSDPVLFEAVPNVSTADPSTVRELAACLSQPPELRLLQVSSDAIHGRTVFTVVGELEPLLDALVELGRKCVERLDLRRHVGVHPFVGVLDACPLVPLPLGSDPELAAEPARQLAERLAAEVGLPAVLYDVADPNRTPLPELRRGGLSRLERLIANGEVESFQPVAEVSQDDRARRGIACVGARGLLVAFNMELATGELRVARRIAGQLREDSGGLPAVRALGLRLSDDRVQVSMNLVDPARTSVERAFEEVRRLAEAEGVAVRRSELVGCATTATWPAGHSATVLEPSLEDAEVERDRMLDTWLPGGARAEEPGIDPEELPETPSDGSVNDGQEPEPVVRLRLLDLPLAEAREKLSELVEEMGERSYRAGQVLHGVWGAGRRSFDQMTDLPRELRTRLASRVELGLLQQVDSVRAQDGTVRFLWRLPDGAEVESVSIPSPRRTTFCVSSQVGCSLKCKFCATGYLGYVRNLSAGEIVDQCLAMLEHEDIDRESLNVVFMGQGEPGHAMRSVLPAARALNDAAGLGIGARRITISTSGVVAAIGELAREPLQLRLAVSLHAADQDLRESLMNIARRHPLPELMAACRSYHAATRRRITFEYCVIPGVNDREQDVTGLVELLADLSCKVNLIPYNPVEQYQAQGADPSAADRFAKALAAARAPFEVMIRHPRGRDVEAACGMLHRVREASAEAEQAELQFDSEVPDAPPSKGSPEAGEPKDAPETEPDGVPEGEAALS